MKRITIKDIARLVGVDVSTVSRALKDHPGISAKTKQKIKDVAEELGYFPNHQAINFRQRRSKLIGLILPELGRFFFPDLIRAIEEIAHQKGYTFITFQSNDLLEKEKNCVKMCRNFGVDGLLVCLSKETQSVEHFTQLDRYDIPVVFVDKIIPEQVGATVTIDDFQAAFMAVSHLLTKGYRQIAGVFADPHLAITQQRFAGYKAALEKHGISYDARQCCFINDLKTAQPDFKMLLQQHSPDALFTMSDELLATVIPVIYAQKISVPQDLAIISISNGYLPYHINPAITHIKHSGYDLGYQAANLLLDLIEHPTTTIHQNLELETFLVELDSC
ncbi:MAG: LacI family DNA-binding transcriptional regulator [Saprospiraceae bacterium]